METQFLFSFSDLMRQNIVIFYYIVVAAAIYNYSMYSLGKLCATHIPQNWALLFTQGRRFSWHLGRPQGHIDYYLVSENWSWQLVEMADVLMARVSPLFLAHRGRLMSFYLLPTSTLDVQLCWILSGIWFGECHKSQGPLWVNSYVDRLWRLEVHKQSV
jgi:hypothetical protein